MSPAEPGRRLHDVGVAVTRAESRSRSLSKRLEELGARILDWQSVEIVPIDFQESLPAREAIDWIVFTSARAVRPIAAIWPDPGARVAAVGEGTARALAEVGWQVDHQPQQFGSSELAASLLTEGARALSPIKGARVLFPTSAAAERTLERTLRKGGALVQRLEVYKPSPARLDGRRCQAEVEAGQVDVVTFTSPSAVDGLTLSLADGSLPSLLEGVAVVAIGPTTAQALGEAGRPPDRVAEPRTLDGLVEAVLEVAAR